jgi:hypothetical protein
MQRADGGANIVMKHTGINYGGRPNEMSEAERLEIGRHQLAMYHGQDHEAKFRADVMTRLGRIEKKIEELILRAGLR